MLAMKNLSISGKSIGLTGVLSNVGAAGLKSTLVENSEAIETSSKAMRSVLSRLVVTTMNTSVFAYRARRQCPVAVFEGNEKVVPSEVVTDCACETLVENERVFSKDAFTENDVSTLIPALTVATGNLAWADALTVYLYPPSIDTAIVFDTDCVVPCVTESVVVS